MCGYSCSRTFFCLRFLSLLLLHFAQFHCLVISILFLVCSSVGEKQTLHSSIDPPPFTSDPVLHSSIFVQGSSSPSTDHIFVLDGDFGDFAKENPLLTFVGKVMGSRPYRQQTVFKALPVAWNASYGVELLHRNVAPHLVNKIGSLSQIMLIKGLFQGQPLQFLRARVTLERSSFEIFFNYPESIWPGKAFLGHDINRCSQCFEADQSHRVIHGCHPLLPCLLLPPRVFDSDIKGVTPNSRMLESTKFLDFSSPDSVGVAQASVSILALSSCSSGGPTPTPSAPLQLTVPFDVCHLALPHSVSSSNQCEAMSSHLSDASKRRYFSSDPSPSLPTMQPLSVLPPLFLDQYAIPPHVLQNPAFTTTVLQLLPRFLNISLQSPSPTTVKICLLFLLLLFHPLVCHPSPPWFPILFRNQHLVVVQW
ncbi:hypothetical protein NE237_007963 [Protea cynaroides]|uniref:Uncharacterized protein n=1 Tax=Protea cynaroides TaxID=273540 RepID=A0A9Q0QWZ8_9MAGN|nr:hypothetical protein NE237_007963 [Protea cynaroides]